MFARRFARTAINRRVINASRTVPRRNMGGQAEVPTEGLDGIVRKFLPKDEHVRFIVSFWNEYILQDNENVNFNDDHSANDNNNDYNKENIIVEIFFLFLPFNYFGLNTLLTHTINQFHAQ